MLSVPTRIAVRDGEHALKERVFSMMERRLLVRNPTASWQCLSSAWARGDSTRAPSAHHVPLPRATKLHWPKQAGADVVQCGPPPYCLSSLMAGLWDTCRAVAMEETPDPLQPHRRQVPLDNAEIPMLEPPSPWRTLQHLLLSHVSFVLLLPPCKVALGG